MIVGFRKTHMAKNNRAELMTLHGRRLLEMHIALHHGPAAICSLRCKPASRLVLAFLLATVSLAVGCGKTNAAPAIPAPEVEVASVVQKDAPIFRDWVATLNGYVNAQFQPQVTGYIIRQTYKGRFVCRQRSDSFSH